jgi:hypothetical protein
MNSNWSRLLTDIIIWMMSWMLRNNGPCSPCGPAILIRIPFRLRPITRHRSTRILSISPSFPAGPRDRDNSPNHENVIIMAYSRHPVRGCFDSFDEPGDYRRTQRSVRTPLQKFHPDPKFGCHPDGFFIHGWSLDLRKPDRCTAAPCGQK